ncbi:MAG: tetratricopeptide repeat protein, partial [Gammaproteobacteria bacterium]
IAAMPVEDTERMRNFRIVMLEGAGRDADVEAALRSLARDFPDQERYTQALAVRFTQTGRVDEAERIMRELADRDDAGFARRLDYVVFLEDQRSAAAAEAAIRVFLDETPGSAELRLTLGNLYDSEGRSDEALAAYREVVELAPASDQAFEARNRIASIRFRQGEADEARALIGAILADRPDDVDALLGRAAFNYADGNFDEVVADARSAIRKDSGSAQARLLLARAHARKGEVLLAQDAYQQLLALDPWNPAAAGELAASYLGQGDTKRAESLWRGMLEQRTDDANARLGLIGTLISEGASADAEEQARQLIELDPSDPRGHLALGQVFAAAGRDTDAIAAYRKALEIDPESTAALREFVVLLNGSGAPARAVDYLDGYIEAHPDMPYARLLLASAWQAAGDRARARALYEALIADRALATAPYRDLAAMYDPGSDERRAALASGVEAFPGDAQLSLFLGQEYERAGQIREAIDTYGAALSANADNDLLANNLASLLLDGGDDPDDFSRALEIAQRFRGSRKAPYLDTLGWAYYRNADYPNAVRHLETAVAMAGQIPVLRYHLGMAYLATGNRVNARQELERAVAMGTAGFPGRDEAESSLAGLQAGS